MRSDPRRYCIERRSIEFVVVAVGDSDRVALRLQLWQHGTEFVCKLLGAIGCDVQTLKDQAALISAFFAVHEVKAVVRHLKVSPIPNFSLPQYCDESESSLSATRCAQL